MLRVCDIADAVAAGRMRPGEALAQSLEAIARREQDVQAFEALAEGGDLLEATDRATGPLAGIAVGVKDIFDTHDMPTGYGSPIYAGHRPRADAAIVAMARRAGATVVGKTVTTEFAFFAPGKTRNPHDPAHTPGGSSSGSAAAVAAGMVPAAIGTQTGGSVIRPAAFCGVAGYKPSFRLVPVTGMKTFSWTLDTAGFFAAGIADVARFAAALTGRPLEVEPVEPKRLRIGLYRSAVWNEASAAMRAAAEDTAASAEAAGAIVVEVEEPEELRTARDIHATIQDFEAALALAGDFEQNRERLSEKLRGTLENGMRIDATTYDEARRTARHARHRASELFEDVDVLLTPSAPGAAPKGLETTGVPLFNKLWTLTGNPCVNVPGITGNDGLPLGIQIVARFGRDRVALSAASWIEAVLPSGRTATA